LAWNHLVLATGAGARRLEHIAPATGIHVLRSYDDARRLWSEALAVERIAVIGAGFVGLEFAASLNAKGVHVTVIEFAGRVMARAVSPAMSQFVERHHRAAGIELLTETAVIAAIVSDGAVRGLEFAGERTLATDLVLVAIGARPNTDLAVAAGLDVDDGVLVDAHMRTSVAGVLAIGDCARWCEAGGRTRRLESVQNASDQATVAARSIVGAAAEYDAVPWFWSDQGALRLQMAGIAEPGDDSIVHAGDDGATLTVIHHHDRVLRCVETVNQPGEHLAARRLVGGEIDIEALEGGVTLKQIATGGVTG
jgi:3-phenylpropionate/trans-cinnamate dioxygenase ferredoxin reductase subunit